MNTFYNFVLLVLLISFYNCNEAPGVLPQLENQSNLVASPIKQSIDSLNKWAWSHRKRNATEALAVATRTFNQSNSYGYQLGKGMALKTLGALKIYNEEKDEGIEHYENAIEALEKDETSKVQIASIYLLMGNVKKNLGDYDKAVEYYYEGIRFAEEGEDKILVAIIQPMLANVKIEQQKFEEARSLFQKTIAIQEESNDKASRRAVTYYAYGSFLSQMKDLDSAMIYYQKAESIFQDIGDLGQQAKVLSGKANVLLQMGELPQALDLYKRSLKIKESLSDKRGMAFSHHQIGHVLYQLKQYAEARLKFEKCLKEATVLNMPGLRSKAFLSLSKIDEAIGKHKEALYHYSKYIDIKDSTLNLATTEKITEIEEQYENEKLERNIEQQKAKLRQNKILIAGILIALFLAIVIAIITINFYRQKKEAALLINRQSEEIHKQKLIFLSKEAELKASNSLIDGQEIEKKRIAETLHDSMGSLLSAVQLHFNSLAKQLPLDQDSTKELWDKTSQLVQEASSYNRELAYQLMPPVLIKLGLPGAIDYLADRVRVPGFNVVTSIYGFENRLPENMELILYRVIDELLNNIIKHANASEVEIQLTAHENEVNVMVIDNGSGFNFDPLNPKYGLGLNNIQSRVKHFNGVFTIDSRPEKGTTVIINLPT